MATNIIQITLGSQIVLSKPELPGQVSDYIRTYHTHDNPKFLDAKKHNYYTGNIDPKIFCYQEDENYLYLPRGYMGNLIPFLCRNGLEYRIDDQRRVLPDIKFMDIKFTFQGELREYQQRAVMEALQKDFGVLVAPCGSGKTVMALSIMVQRRQPALIVVHTKELLNQWVDRITQYLGIPQKKSALLVVVKSSFNPSVSAWCRRYASGI